MEKEFYPFKRAREMLLYAEEAYTRGRDLNNKRICVDTRGVYRILLSGSADNSSQLWESLAHAEAVFQSAHENGQKGSPNIGNRTDEVWRYIYVWPLFPVITVGGGLFR